MELRHPILPHPETSLICVGHSKGSCPMASKGNMGASQSFGLKWQVYLLCHLSLFRWPKYAEEFWSKHLIITDNVAISSLSCFWSWYFSQQQKANLNSLERLNGVERQRVCVSLTFRSATWFSFLYQAPTTPCLCHMTLSSGHSWQT